MVDEILDILKKDGMSDEEIKLIKGKIKRKKLNFALIFMILPEKGDMSYKDYQHWHFDHMCPDCINRLIVSLEKFKINLLSRHGINDSKKEEPKYIG